MFARGFERMHITGKPTRVRASISRKAELTGLVADDVYTCRNILQTFLNALDVRTQAVESGQEALELITSGVTFDIILVEMNMPVLDGLETVRELRARGVESKIVGMSLFREIDEERILDAGADDYLEKPILPENLAPIVQDVLRSKGWE